MALFNDSPEDWEKLDWKILRDGGIAFYWRLEYLADDVQWLIGQNYDIYEFDCKQWNSEKEMHSDIARVLRFSEWMAYEWGQNFDALDDCLQDLPIGQDGGAALVFRRFDVYATGTGSVLSPSGRARAEVLLDVMARVCRFLLLNGKRFVTLVQTDNHDFQVGPLGAISPIWNAREWLDANRRPGLRKETSK
jgi:hypothetical protein